MARLRGDDAREIEPDPRGGAERQERAVVGAFLEQVRLQPAAGGRADPAPNELEMDIAAVTAPAGRHGVGLAPDAVPRRGVDRTGSTHARGYGLRPARVHVPAPKEASVLSRHAIRPLAPILAVLLLVLTACGSDTKPNASGSGSGSSAAPRKITILQVSHTLSFLPLYVAQRLGYFSESGVDVEVTDAPGEGATNSAALKKGDAWGLVTGPEQAMLANAHGLDLRTVVAVTQLATQSLVGRASFRSSGNLADNLRGKRIGVSNLGTATREAGIVVLRFIGLDAAQDVTLIEGSDSTRVAGLEKGDLDFIFLTQPSLARAQIGGLVGEPLVSTAEAVGHVHGNSLIVTQDEITGDPATVQAVVHAMIKACKLIAEHPDQAFAVAQAEFPDVTPEALRAAFDFDVREGFWSPDGKLTDEGLQRSKEFAKVMGSLSDGDIDMAKAVDHQFGG